MALASIEALAHVEKNDRVVAKGVLPLDRLRDLDFIRKFATAELLPLPQPSPP